FGKNIELDSLVDTLTLGGYERVNMVEGVGQFSLRGGIIDIFPPDSENPYRIELFDEEVDSIRSFDIVTQRSIQVIDSVTIIPVKDILITENYRDKTIHNLKKEITKQNPKEETKGKFNRYIELLEDRSPDINNDMILPYIPNEYLGSIIDY